MSVSKRLRFEIFRRDNHACRYCGATASDTKLTIDHVTPTALGGTDGPGNLVTACTDCNSGKSATLPNPQLVADVQQDALRWDLARKAAAGEHDLFVQILCDEIGVDSTDRIQVRELAAQSKDVWTEVTSPLELALLQQVSDMNIDLASYYFDVRAAAEGTDVSVDDLVRSGDPLDSAFRITRRLADVVSTLRAAIAAQGVEAPARS